MKYNKRLIERGNLFTKNILSFLKISIFVFVVIIIYNIFLTLISISNEKEITNVFGYSAYIITTESMKPTLNVGDLIITKKVNEKYLKKDDIITFSKNFEIITHRIVIKNNEEYITKGDNNISEDLFVLKSDEILGRKVFKIPYLGNIIGGVKNIFHIFIIFITLITMYLHNRRKNKKMLIRRKKKRLEDEKNKSN